MRTTLDIDPDVLQAAKEIASREKSTAGAIISRLAREGLTSSGSKAAKTRNGVMMLPKRGEIVTHQHVRNLMDEEGI